MLQSGFRLDRHFEHRGHLTFQGDVYQGEIGHDYKTLVPEGQEHNGGNLLLNWSSDPSNNIQQEWLLYYDRTELKTSALVDRRETWNLDYQALYRWHTHAVVMGAGYRNIADDIDAIPGFQLPPPERDDKVYSAFVQDDIALLANKLHFIVGTKYERNDYSNEEWQPSVRASYAFEQALVWSAWSRAVRIPTRLEHDLVIAGLAGGRNLDPEYADVYELGWRYDHNGRWLLDISTYIGKYRDLLTIEPPSLGNEMSGDVKGFEVSFDMEPKPGWLLRVNYSHAEMDLSVSDSSLAVGSAEQIEGLMPRNTAQFSSLWNIDERWNLNTYIRYVDEPPTQGVDSYWVADLTLAWRLNDKWQLQFVGRHLGDGEHHEWGGSSTAVEPDAALYISWGRWPMVRQSIHAASLSLKRNIGFCRGLCKTTALVLCLNSVAVARASDIAYQIKASYIYNLLQFVKFPESELSANHDIDVCILGENRFGFALNEVDGASVPQGQLNIRYLGRYDSRASGGNSRFDNCHVVYIVASEKRHIKAILGELDLATVLTISEFSPFISRGGLIELFVRDDSIRFRINEELVTKTHFRVEAQLVQLGVKR